MFRRLTRFVAATAADFQQEKRTEIAIIILRRNASVSDDVPMRSVVPVYKAVNKQFRVMVSASGLPLASRTHLWELIVRPRVAPPRNEDEYMDE